MYVLNGDVVIFRQNDIIVLLFIRNNKLYYSCKATASRHQSSTNRNRSGSVTFLFGG